MHLRSPLLTGVLAGLLSTISQADVRLLTGDSNNNVHSSSSEITDLSADGDLVVFVTGPPVSGSTPGITRGGAYLRKISTGELSYLVGDTGQFIGVASAVISDDGRYVAWESTTRSTSGTTGNARNIYWRDRQTNTTRLITAAADQACIEPKISADGRYVAFSSNTRTLPVSASKLPSTNGRFAVYLYDSQSESLDIISLAPDGSALSGIGGTSVASAQQAFDFSADGRFVVYATDSLNSHPDRSANMTASFLAICRREISSGAVVLVNRNAAGNVVDGNFVAPRIDADGSRVGFAGSFIAIFKPANPMVTGAPANFGSDAFVKDLDSAEVWLVSKTTNGTAHAGSFGTRFAIDADGDVFSYASTATNLVAQNSDAGGGHSGSFDIFRIDLGASGTTTNTLITESPTNSGNVDYRNGPYLPGSGAYVAFSTDQVQEMIGTPSTFHQGIGVGSFPAAPPAGLTYNDWAAVLPPADRDFTDNPARDGVDNLTKYMMGMDPSVPDRSQLPTSSTSPATALGLPAGPERYLTLQLRIRRDLPVGFSWTVRTADTLAGLSAGAGNAVQVGSATPDGDFDIYLFRFPNPTSALPNKGFMDVLLTAP